ncbi:MAG: alpha/beta fold hydrolase [Bacteroidota bacterium]
MELAYREYGSGQPLIILHGLFGQSDNWNTLTKRFAEKGFRVFAIDQRNHGLSPHSSEWDYNVMASDLNEFIKLHDLKEPILLGHSMGGKTVLFFEMLYPNIAKKIIVVDIAPRAYEPHHEAVLKALNAIDFTEINTRKEAEAILNEYISDFGTKQFLLKNIYWKEDASKQMAWRFDLKTITEKYDNIGIEAPEGVSNTPALFIRGGNSNYITDADEKDIAARFSDYKLETVENSGHWVHAEQPEAFFNDVMAFIA